ncbi:hypothetical protein SAMN06265222_11359 [Neorhodopirellula lusitana]|uniref:Secreted protein n=1 Tax=Neorhodopirellula lusitana TaxID=445327 RepID=A0ABY1QKC9_9BACT|nr:hypothetical protein [Neorhodopirellula lusitana]SMP70490.1 hypothetical protein SAMN06265222_11359 [Neorhodopirellula lusitana]
MRQLRIPGGVAIILLTVFTGCTGESLLRVPTSDAEFSTPADYENYDHEMRELSLGQPE